MLVFDRGYNSYDWWLRLTCGKVKFVTRLKGDAAYTIIEKREIGDAPRIVRDEVILLNSQIDVGPEARLRRIEAITDDGKDTIVFVTNHLKLAATTIAAVCRDRLGLSPDVRHESRHSWLSGQKCTGQ